MQESEPPLKKTRLSNHVDDKPVSSVSGIQLPLPTEKCTQVVQQQENSRSGTKKGTFRKGLVWTEEELAKVSARLHTHTHTHTHTHWIHPLVYLYML